MEVEMFGISAGLTDCTRVQCEDIQHPLRVRTSRVKLYPTNTLLSPILVKKAVQIASVIIGTDRHLAHIQIQNTN